MDNLEPLLVHLCLNPQTSRPERLSSLSLFSCDFEQLDNLCEVVVVSITCPFSVAVSLHLFTSFYLSLSLLLIFPRILSSFSHHILTLGASDFSFRPD